VPEFLVEKPSTGEVILRTALAAAIETVVLFFMLLVVLRFLRRWTDMTFPEGPAFYRGVLVIAAAAALLWLVPIVGWILALVTVATLTIRFFDGDVLDGFYAAVALWGTHALTGMFLLAHLRGAK
jgi:hypothetical protein